MAFYYKKRVARADTPQDVALRLKDNQARAQVLAEIKERFPVLTATNFDDAEDYRRRRLRELVPDTI